MAPSPTRESVIWTACLAAGYASFLLMGELAVAYAGVATDLWSTRFWVRCAVAVAASLGLWPVFLRLAHRPGFLDGYGRYLSPALLGLTVLSVFAALLRAESPTGLRLLASLVGARLP